MIHVLRGLLIAMVLAILAAGVSIGCCTSGTAGKIDWSRVDVGQCTSVLADLPPVAGEVAACFGGANYETCITAIVAAGKATPEVVACVASLVAALGADHAPTGLMPDAAPVTRAKAFLDAHVPPDASAPPETATPALLRLNRAVAAGSQSGPPQRARAWLAARHLGQ